MRVALPLFLIVVWFIAAGVGGPYFGKIEEVSTNDPATFLPENAESTEVRERLTAFQDDTSVPLLVVFESNSALTTSQLDEVNQTRQDIIDTNIPSDEVSPAVVSEDKEAAFLVVPLEGDSDYAEVIGEFEAVVDKGKSGTETYFTGPAMFSRDLQNAFAGIDGTLLVVALSVVFLILLIVYRSPILPFVTLVGAISALSAAILAVFYLAKADLITLNGQVQGILFILVIGAATDYSLLYISRYREELQRHKTALAATIASWKASIEPIVAAGGTVILGLLCLLASDLGSNQALGPVGGLGIVFSMLVALTFLPSAMLLLGRTAYWPRRPKFSTSNQKTDYRTTHPLWAKVARLVEKHPRKLWMGIAAALLVACIGVPQLQAEGVSQSNLILGESEARDGQDALDRHFPSGSGSPAVVLASVDEQDEVVAVLQSEAGVSDVLAIGENIPQVPVGEAAKEARDVAEARIAALPAPAQQQARKQAAGQPDLFAPKVVADTVALSATLVDDASSVAARQTVDRLRADLAEVAPEAQVGGISAIQLDTNNASQRDLRVIIPLILLSITIVLMVLLRSIVAPLLLVLTTVLSFGATIGIAALLFNNVLGYSGADPSIILFGFVFLVALGIDYNIFLMTRVREETIKLGVKDGTLKALIVTGGVITSAGIVLAATFVALYVIPILFLAQIAFIVSFGVLLDTLIVRSLLVPALTLDVGKPIWWPSKLSKSEK